LVNSWASSGVIVWNTQSHDVTGQELDVHQPAKLSDKHGPIQSQLHRSVHKYFPEKTYDVQTLCQYTL
jgi:hypothetical protein